MPSETLSNGLIAATWESLLTTVSNAIAVGTIRFRVFRGVTMDEVSITPHDHCLYTSKLM